MTIAEKLSRIVARSRSIDDLLASAVKTISDELHADACSLFLLEPGESLTPGGRRLRLRAASGESSRDAGHAATAQAVAEGLAGVALTQMLPETREERSRSLLAVPMALRGQPIGVIVVQAGRRTAYTAAEIQTLFAVASQMVGIVENARLLEAMEGRVELANPPFLALQRLLPREGEQVLRGVAVSPGIAVGAAVFRGALPKHHACRAPRAEDRAAERARVRDAFAKARNDVAHIQEAAARDLGEEHAFIFTSHLVMLADPALHERIEVALASGRSAFEAIDAALLEIADRLRGARDPYLQERVEDIDDLRSRLLGHMLIREDPSSRAHIVVAPRIAPSLVMEMKAQAARGIVAQIGGATSHGALLARSLGIPAVAGIEDVLEAIDAGDVVVVDGLDGAVVVRPTAETLARYEEEARREARRRTEFAKYGGRSATTADGVRVSILANVAFGADLALAKENGAEGVGLYRTEFPFIVRAGFPTRDEQVRIYRKAYDAFPDAPVTLRILDLAGDKFISSRGAAAARGAFHGYRSIRVLFDYPHVLRDQVQAFALAAAARPLRILVPMVSSVEELLRVQEMTARALEQIADLDAQRSPRFGAMIEVPGAVEIAADLARHVDFFSIGTNDLIQYTLVVDREDARLWSSNDAYHPAVLRMIRRAIQTAHGARKPVSVCGEMAARPDLALALAALGADELSVAPAAIPELKQAIASLSIGPLTAGIDRVLDSPDARTLQCALRAALQ